MRNLKLYGILALAGVLPLLMAPTPSAPPAVRLPILCTTACNVSALRIGQSAYIIKPASTNRSSVTALALDPDLQFNSVPAGKYWASVSFSALGGVGGFSWAPNALTQVNAIDGTFECGTAQGTVVGVNNFGGGVGTQLNCAANSNLQNVTFGLAGGVSFTFGVSWAQFASNAASSTLNGGAQLVITRTQ